MSRAWRAASPSAGFLARFPTYRLAGEPTRGGRVRFRGFLSIPVVV
jgi:hypothetical protein